MPDTNPAVFTEFALPDPNVAPLNLIQLVQLLNTLVSSRIDPESTYMSYVVGSDQPSADDQDKVWFVKDSQGRPTAAKVFWHGRWRRMYNGMLGEVRAFNGAPGYGPPPAFFDVNGMGNAEGEFDGWHICNGKDGTPDFSDRFVIGAHMNKSDSKNDYDDGEWVTWVGGKEAQRTGGGTEFTLGEKNTFQPGTNIGTLHVGKYKIDPDGGETLTESGFHLWGVPSANNEDKNTLLDIQSTGNPTPDPISIINPFVALGWIIFVGYQS